MPVSAAQGRFVADETTLRVLIENGQIAFQYTDADGNPSMDIAHNPTGSLMAVEGITSPDGRILGKLAHPERTGRYVGTNIPGDRNQPLFEGGVRYYR